MKTIALERVDPSIAVSVMAALVLFVAIVPSPTVMRFLRLLFETAWLYLTNTRG